MLTVHGLVGIPKDEEIKVYDGKRNCFFNFAVVVQDPRKQNSWHKYPVRIACPPEKKEEFMKQLNEGRVFYVDNASWSMEIKNENKIPFPTLQCYYTSFRKLSKELV
jgi:hypothetical protein